MLADLFVVVPVLSGQLPLILSKFQVCIYGAESLLNES